MQIVLVKRGAILLMIFLSVLSSQMAHILSVSHFKSKKLSKASPNSIDAPFPHKKPFRKSTVPRCIDNKLSWSLCNKTETYPFAKIDKKIRNKKILREFKQLFGVAVAPFKKSPIAMRFNFEDRNLCPTRTYKYYPKMAQNTKGKDRIIVQAKSNYTQEVSIVKCLKERQPCGNQESLDLHSKDSISQLKTFCKQELITVRLLALDDNGNFVQDYFPIEGGCACFQTRDVFS